MIIKESTSVILSDKLFKYIENRYSVSISEIELINKDEMNIFIMSNSEKLGYSIQTPMVLETKDIFMIISEILSNDKIVFKENEFKFIIKEGSATDRTDREFIGVQFIWKDKESYQ